MPRNVALQVVRGVKANLPTLLDGEFYFATDTGELYVGLSGFAMRVALMAVPIPIQDSAGNNLTSTAGALDINIKSDALPLPVTATSLPLPTGAATEASVTNGNQKTQVTNFPATQSTTQVGGSSGLVGDTQAKGVQGTVALMVQDFKDAGRVVKIFTSQFTAATTEGLVTLTPTSDFVAGAPATTFAVTSGKRFRIQGLFLTCFNITAAIHACQVNLRISPTGAVTGTSPIAGTVATSTAAATINLANSQAQSFPEGLELSGSMQFGISQIGIALAGQTVVLVGYEY